MAIEFAHGGKGHMVHVHVQAHAHGIGGHEIIHFARLLHFDLGIAGAGTERTHDHCCPAAMAAQ